MPVLKKEIELDDGTKIWVRQASGREKVRIESIQAKAVRKCREFGDPTKWTEEQNNEFLDIVEALGGGIEHQMEQWLPKCILDETITIDDLNSFEARRVLAFVRGDEEDGAIPLGSSPE